MIFANYASPLPTETDYLMDVVYEGGASDIGKIRLIVNGRDAFV